MTCNICATNIALYLQIRQQYTLYGFVLENFYLKRHHITLIFTVESRVAVAPALQTISSPMAVVRASGPNIYATQRPRQRTLPAVAGRRLYPPQLCGADV